MAPRRNRFVGRDQALCRQRAQMTEAARAQELRAAGFSRGAFHCVPYRLAVRCRGRRRHRLGAPHRRRNPSLDNRCGICRYREPLPVHARAEHRRHCGLRRGEAARVAIGTIAALAGFLVIPWAVGLSLGLLYLKFAHLTVLRNILGGIAAAAAGLLIATGIRLLLPHRRRPAALVFAALAFGLIIFGRLPLLIVLFSLVPLSIAVAYIENARAR